MVQEALLARAAPSVKPGGRLVYAVCTLTRSETAVIADGFEAAHPDFEPVSAGDRVQGGARQLPDHAPPPGPGRKRHVHRGMEAALIPYRSRG
jgi:16S rRNA C967 or C1407 C5-methylase (RsmB/RsmF family)